MMMHDAWCMMAMMIKPRPLRPIPSKGDKIVPERRKWQVGNWQFNAFRQRRDHDPRPLRRPSSLEQAKGQKAPLHCDFTHGGAAYYVSNGVLVKRDCGAISGALASTPPYPTIYRGDSFFDSVILLFCARTLQNPCVPEIVIQNL